MNTVIKGMVEQIDQMPVWGIYLFLFVSGFLQVIFAPYPGEVILVFSGYLATLQRYRGLGLFLAYWSSIIISNFIIYELGVRYGEKVLSSSFVHRIFSEKSREKSKVWVQKYGFFVYIIAIFIPGMYLPTVLISGILGCRRHWAYAGMIVATLVHDIMLYASGGFLGGNWEDINRFLLMYKKTAVLAVVAVAAIFVICRIVIYMKKRGNQKV